MSLLLVVKVFSGTVQTKVMLTGEDQNIIWVFLTFGTKYNFRVIKVHF